MEIYLFTTNETNEIHRVSGYSMNDALDMLEKAGYTMKTYNGFEAAETHEEWVERIYGGTSNNSIFD